MSQSDLRAVQKLEFCYLCGHDFDANSERTKDHIPPRAIFAEADRDFPLLIPAHGGCNRDRSSEDEVIGQLISLLHGRVPKPNRDRLTVEIRQESGRELGILTGLQIEAVIRRWLMAFHAALYKEPLPPNTRFATQCPFPSGSVEEDSITVHEIPPQHRLFVEELKRNRMTGCLDSIVCNNGKLRYECVWVRMDDGGWGCIYGLDLYGWKNLGDIHNFEPRGCAGLYRKAEATFPKGAMKATNLKLRLANNDPLDPFAA